MKVSRTGGRITEQLESQRTTDGCSRRWASPKANNDAGPLLLVTGHLSENGRHPGRREPEKGVVPLLSGDRRRKRRFQRDVLNCKGSDPFRSFRRRERGMDPS